MPVPQRDGSAGSGRSKLTCSFAAFWRIESVVREKPPARRLQNALAQSNNWLDIAVLKRNLNRAGRFVRKVSVDLPTRDGSANRDTRCELRRACGWAGARRGRLARASVPNCNKKMR